MRLCLLVFVFSLWLIDGCDGLIPLSPWSHRWVPPDAINFSASGTSIPARLTQPIPMIIRSTGKGHYVDAAFRSAQDATKKLHMLSESVSNQVRRLSTRLYARTSSFVRNARGGRSGNNIQAMITPTNMLITANVVIFLTCKKFPRLTHRFLKSNAMVLRGESYRLLTSLFLHGSVQHLLMNSYSLYNIGSMATSLLGQGRFMAFYLMSGVLGNALTFMAGVSPYTLGASGCIYGLIGALAVFFYRNKGILRGQSEMGLESIKRTLLMNVMYGVMMAGGNIDQWGHAGGFASGALLAYLFGPRLSYLSTR
jgi:membrane associated rhomboid family serine protease